LQIKMWFWGHWTYPVITSPRELPKPPQNDGFCSPALSTAPSKRLQRPPLCALRWAPGNWFRSRSISQCLFIWGYTWDTNC
jgi:hypothetical protein